MWGYNCACVCMLSVWHLPLSACFSVVFSFAHITHHIHFHCWLTQLFLFYLKFTINSICPNLICDNPIAGYLKSVRIHLKRAYRKCGVVCYLLHPCPRKCCRTPQIASWSLWHWGSWRDQRGGNTAERGETDRRSVEEFQQPLMSCMLH